MRIAWLAETGLANGYYRSIAPLLALVERGHQIVQIPVDGPAARRPFAFAGFDLLHIHRFADQRALQLAQAAKAAGAAVVWDNDDDDAALPRDVHAYRSNGGLVWERTRVVLKRLFALTDLVTTPTQRLEQRFRELGATDTCVIENYVINDFRLTRERPHDGIEIGWTAGAEHRMDLDRIPIREALQRLLDTRPEVRVVSIGAALGLSGDRYTRIPNIHLRDLSSRATGFDVGIAPLADIPFNRSRSNIKLKEYAAAGIPWLASPIGPYAGLGEKQGGRLVADDGWFEALDQLAGSARQRRKLGKRAERWAKEQTVTAHIARWEELFAAAIARGRAVAAVG